GQIVDGKGDVYSLALVLIEAVTGRVPFTADTTIATLMARVDTPVLVPDELGPLRPALERAGRPDPQERPDAAEFGARLLAASEQLPRPDPLPLVGATAALGDIAVVDRDPTQLPPPSPAVAPTGDVEVAPPDDAAAPAATRRRRWLVPLLVALAVVALGGGAAFAWTNLLVPSHKVPTLVGLTEQQARAQVDAHHWKLRRLEGRQDGTRPGDVIAQDPRADTSLKEGKTVTITVSLGNTLVAVPTDLPGKTVEDAVAELQATFLDVGTQTPQHDENVKAGVVIAVDPATPAQLPKGEKVNLIVSDGPAPRTVPQLDPSMTVEQAQAAIAAVQLKGAPEEQFSDTVPAGQLIGTDPPAGTEVPRDSTVKILVSKGPQPVAVPDVSGQSVAD